MKRIASKAYYVVKKAEFGDRCSKCGKEHEEGHNPVDYNQEGDLVCKFCDEDRRMSTCSGCGKVDAKDVDERYSCGHYAGIFCTDCAKRKYRDQCGLGPGGQGRDPDIYGDEGDYDYTGDDRF